MGDPRDCMDIVEQRRSRFVEGCSERASREKGGGETERSTTAGMQEVERSRSQSRAACLGHAYLRSTSRNNRRSAIPITQRKSPRHYKYRGLLN